MDMTKESAPSKETTKS